MSKGKSMRKKCVAIAITIVFLGISFIPTISQGTEKPWVPLSEYSAKKTNICHYIIPGPGFGLQSILWISWGNETQEPLVPGGAPQNVTLNVTYGTTLLTPVLGRIILLYYLVKHQYITVTLKIGEIPSWCTVSLSNSELQFPINLTKSSQHTTITVAVDEHAPAYCQFYVPINVSVETVRGPFGIFPFVNGYENIATFSFIPGYRPSIIVKPVSDYLNATPGNLSVLQINITNDGNARTIVFTDIVGSPPAGWVITMTSMVVLDVNMTAYAYIAVRPPNDFVGTEVITLSFTPCMADDPTQCGDPVYRTITVICEP